MKLWTMINHKCDYWPKSPAASIDTSKNMLPDFWFCLSTISGFAFLPFLVLPFYHFWFCLSTISGFAFLPFLVLPFCNFVLFWGVSLIFFWIVLLSVIHTKGNSLPAYTGCKLAGSITVMTGWGSLMTLLHGLLLINEGSIITVELNYSLFRF